MQVHVNVVMRGVPGCWNVMGVIKVAMVFIVPLGCGVGVIRAVMVNVCDVLP